MIGIRSPQDTGSPNLSLFGHFRDGAPRTDAESVPGIGCSSRLRAGCHDCV